MGVYIYIYSYTYIHNIYIYIHTQGLGLAVWGLRFGVWVSITIIWAYSENLSSFTATQLAGTDRRWIVRSFV